MRSLSKVMDSNGGMYPPQATSSSSHWAARPHQQQQPAHGSAGSSRSSTPASHLQPQPSLYDQAQWLDHTSNPATAAAGGHFAFPPPSSPFHPTSPLVAGSSYDGLNNGLSAFMKQPYPHQQHQGGAGSGPSNLSLSGLGPREPRPGNLPSYAFPPAAPVAMPAPPHSPYVQSPLGGSFDFHQPMPANFQMPSFDGLGGGNGAVAPDGNDTLAMAIRLGMSIGMSMGGEMPSPGGSAVASPSFGGGSGSQGPLSPTGEHVWNLASLPGGSSSASSPMNPPMLPRGRGLHHGRDPTGRTAPVPLPSSSASAAANGATPSPSLSSRSFDKSAMHGGGGLYGSARHSRQSSRTADSAVPSPSATASVAPSPSVASTPGQQYASPVAPGEFDEAADDHPTTKVWKLYAQQKSDPAGPRMENLTWRMMAMSLKRDELAQLEAGLGPLSEDDERFLKELKESKGEEADQFDTGDLHQLDTQAALEQLLSPSHTSLASLSASHVSSISHLSKHSASTVSSDHRPKEEEQRGRGRRPTAKVVGFDAGFTGANECALAPLALARVRTALLTLEMSSSPCRPVADLDLMDWRAKSRSRSRMSMDWRAASRSRSRAPFPSAYEPAAYAHNEAHSHALLGALDFLNPNQTKNYGTHAGGDGQASTSAGSQSIPIPMNNASFNLSVDHSHNHPHAQSLLDFGFNDSRGFSLFESAGEVAYSEPGHFPSQMAAASHGSPADEGQHSTSYQNALRTASLFDMLSTDLTAGTAYSQSLPSSVSASDSGGARRPFLARNLSAREPTKEERTDSILVRPSATRTSPSRSMPAADRGGGLLPIPTHSRRSVRPTSTRGASRRTRPSLTR